MDLSHASKSTIRTLVNMGNISREYAAQLATARANTYTAKGKSQSKIDGWVKLAAQFAQAPDATAKPSKAKVKAKQPKAEAAPSPAFSAKPKITKLTKATARELIASRRILTNAEKASLAAFLERI